MKYLDEVGLAHFFGKIKELLANKANVDDIPTEEVVSGWGFTKNSGTYSKPDDGIPKDDLESSVQTSLENADSAIKAPALLRTVMGLSSTVSTASTPGGVFWVNSYNITGVSISKSNVLSKTYSLTAREGYTPMAIVGYKISGTNSNYLAFNTLDLTNIGNNTATLEIGVRNFSTTANVSGTTININILWVRTSL